MAVPTAVTGGREGSLSPGARGRPPGTKQGHLGFASTRAFRTFVATTPSSRPGKEGGPKKKKKRKKNREKKKRKLSPAPQTSPHPSASRSGRSGARPGRGEAAEQPPAEPRGAAVGERRGRCRYRQRRAGDRGEWAVLSEPLHNGRLPRGTRLGRPYVTTLLNTGVSCFQSGAPAQAAAAPGTHPAPAPRRPAASRSPRRFPGRTGSNPHHQKYIFLIKVKSFPSSFL